MVFSDYPASVVEFVADPRTGVIADYPMGLPNVGQIRAVCEATLRRQETLTRFAKMPKYRPYVPPPPSKPKPNLFVPEFSGKYQQMTDFHHKSGGEMSFYKKDHAYLNGDTANGIMVPHHWFDTGSSD